MSLTSQIFGITRSSRSGPANKLWEQLAIATNWPVLLSIAVLCALGVCSIWAHAPADGKKQLIFIGIGSGCLILFQAVNYQRIGRWSWAFYLVAIGLIIYTLLPW